MVAPDAPAPPFKDRTGAVKVAAGLNLAWGGLLLLAAIIAGIGIGTAIDYSIQDGDMRSANELETIRSMVVTILILIGLPYVVGGAAVLARQNWGRVLLFTVSGLGTLLIPFGTIIAIQSFWALTRPGAEPWFGGRP